MTEERSGAFSWYRLAPDADAQRRRRSRAALWTWLREEFDRDSPAAREDDARLEEVRRLRKENFAHHGADRRQLVPGRSWAAWARALGLLLPPLDVADLGCGEGYLTIETARWARRVIAIDRSDDVLARAQALAERRKLDNIVWKRGELERLPIDDASVDVALLSQALHHADDPVGRARRSVADPASGRPRARPRPPRARPGLGPRQARRPLARLRRPAAARRLIAGAGFDDVTVRVGARRTGDPFTVLIARGAKTRLERDHLHDDRAR